MLIRKINKEDMMNVENRIDNSIDLEVIGRNLTQLRKSYNYSQIELAKLLGYSERQYRRLEKEGTNNISVVLKIASFFNIPFVELFTIMEISSNMSLVVC